MEEKKCITCQEIKPFKSFNKEKRNSSGMSGTCKDCSNKSRRNKRYDKNRTIIENKKYLDSKGLRKCKYCNEIKDHSLFTKHKNCEYEILCVCVECSSIRVNKWRAENKDKVLSFYEKYKLNNKTKISETNKIYEQKNRHKINNRIRKRRSPDKHFHIRGILRSRMEHAFNSQSAKKKCETLDLIGCSINELKNYLESLFISGMSWDNYGYYGWHIDHKKPCAKFNLEDPEQQKECFHYTNLQPLWAIDNIKKSDKWE